MSKGFSGINDLSVQNASECQETSAKSNNSAQKTSSGTNVGNLDFVTYPDSKSMPAVWQSKDKGIAWESEDHVFVLQYCPCSETTAMQHALKGGNPFEYLAEKDAGLKYWWILCVYYKPGKGPKFNGTMRWPILIVTLEQANLLFFAKMVGKTLAELGCDEHGWDPPVLCEFLPGGKHLNLGEIAPRLGMDKFSPCSMSASEKEQIEEKIANVFLDIACNRIKLTKRPERIGNMSNGYFAVYNDIMPADVRKKIEQKTNSSGCLGMLLLLPLLGLIALIKTFFS